MPCSSHSKTKNFLKPDEFQKKLSHRYLRRVSRKKPMLTIVRNGFGNSYKSADDWKSNICPDEIHIYLYFYSNDLIRWVYHISSENFVLGDVEFDIFGTFFSQATVAPLG